MIVELVLAIVALWCVCVVLFYMHKVIRWFTGTSFAKGLAPKYCESCGMQFKKNETECDWCPKKEEKFSRYGVSQEVYWPKGNIYAPMLPMRPLPPEIEKRIRG